MVVVKIILKSHPEINFGFKIVNDKYNRRAHLLQD